MSFGGVRHLIDDVSHEGIQVKPLVAPGQFSRLYFGDIEQITDQGDKLVELRLHLDQQRRRVLIACFDKAGVQYLGITFEAGDGRFEFVTGNRHKFLPLLQQLLLVPSRPACVRCMSSIARRMSGT